MGAMCNLSFIVLKKRVQNAAEELAGSVKGNRKNIYINITLSSNENHEYI